MLKVRDRRKTSVRLVLIPISFIFLSISGWLAWQEFTLATFGRRAEGKIVKVETITTSRPIPFPFGGVELVTEYVSTIEYHTLEGTKTQINYTSPRIVRIGDMVTIVVSDAGHGAIDHWSEWISRWLNVGTFGFVGLLCFLFFLYEDFWREPAGVPASTTTARLLTGEESCSSSNGCEENANATNSRECS